jgi:hypothetical protein
MPVIRATLYLKSSSGPKPYRTCYFRVQEYERLLKDYEHYQQQGSPRAGLYEEEVSGSDEHQVMIEFAAIAEIRTNQ